MRKAITLILLFALLAGLAFASEQETHTIRLKSVVENIRPEIQLKITSVNGNSSNQAATNNANDGRGNVFDGSNIYSYDGTVEIFSINEGGTVTFQAVLKNETNTNEVYQLSFGGGVFTGVSRYGEENGVRGPETITTSVGTVIDDSKSDKGIQSISLGSGESSNKPVIVAFHGALDKDVTYRDDVILATAVYAYPEDKTINSNTYYADVTLTVSLV
jgi:hypothetical protein